MKKCVFFDRDGVVNERPDPARYVMGVDKFKILPEFLEVLKIVRDAGYTAVVITNQRCLALGVVSLDVMEDIHAKLDAVVCENVGDDVLLDVKVCPHDNDDGCGCRKPKPGMILEAAEEHDIDLSQSWMIGDNDKDVEAGKAAGCRTIRVTYGKEPAIEADLTVESMQELKQAMPGILSKVIG
ncbi:hypothetical protein BVX97_05690 [bacterium E08(2017)]|nr:hypothetical protein BVX97_05690 [bacterium E08(2017)]